MRRLSTTAVAGGLLAAMLVSLSAWAVYVNAARGEEVAQDGATDGLPSSPPAIYQKLQKRVEVNFQQIKLADTLRSLEKSLGAPSNLIERTSRPSCSIAQ